MKLTALFSKSKIQYQSLKTTLCALLAVSTLTASVGCNALEALKGESAEQSAEAAIRVQPAQILSRQVRIQKARFLALAEQAQIRLAPSLSIRVVKEVAILQAAGIARGMIALDSYPGITRDDLQELAEALQVLVPQFVNKGIALFESGSDTAHLSQVLLEDLHTRVTGLTLAQITKLAPVVLDSLRDDTQEMNVDFAYEMSQLQATSGLVEENLSNYLSRYGIGVKSRETTIYGVDWTIFSNDYEAGNPDSGEYTAVSQYDEVVRGDFDADNNGYPDYDNDGDYIRDNEEKDGRGDGDGFWDSLNDAIQGDDGDGITHESEAGTHLRSQIEALESQYLDRTHAQILNLLESKTALQNNTAILVGPTSNSIVRINTLVQQRTTSSLVKIRTVRYSRPIRF
jgi:hypothetical protein